MDAQNKLERYRSEHRLLEPKRQAILGVQGGRQPGRSEARKRARGLNSFGVVRWDATKRPPLRGGVPVTSTRKYAAKHRKAATWSAILHLVTGAPPSMRRGPSVAVLQRYRGCRPCAVRIAGDVRPSQACAPAQQCRAQSHATLFPPYPMRRHASPCRFP